MTGFAGDNFLHGWECARVVFRTEALPVPCSPEPGAFSTWLLRNTFPPGDDINTIYHDSACSDLPFSDFFWSRIGILQKSLHCQGQVQGLLELGYKGR